MMHGILGIQMNPSPSYWALVKVKDFDGRIHTQVFRLGGTLPQRCDPRLQLDDPRATKRLSNDGDLVHAVVHPAPH